MNIGISFCQVLKIRHGNHDSLAITLGNQKCRGAAPSFSKRLVVNKSKGNIEAKKDEGEEKRIILNRSSADPIAWAKKYLF